MRFYKYFFLLFILPLYALAQETLDHPVDIVYYEPTEQYFVSNWADTNAGYISKLDIDGNIIETYVDGLHYPGGICLVGDILYYTDNLSIWGGGEQPSYIKGIDLTTGNQVLNFEVSTGITYLDLMDTDNSGNLYIGNTRNGGYGIVHKFNIASQELTDLVPQVIKPFGVCYDYLNDQVIFTHSGLTISYLKSVSPEGGDVSTVLFTEGYIEGVTMDNDGHFYFSSWGTPNMNGDSLWGDEPVYKTNLINHWKYKLDSLNNRPFGMCIGHDNHLAVCNWGSNTINFINLDPFDIEENKLNEKNITIFPNPSNGRFSLSLNEINERELNLIITDITGKEIFADHIINNNSSFEKEYTLEDLPKGAYLLIVRGKISIVQEKLIIY